MAKRSRTKKRKKAGAKTSNYHDKMEKLVHEREDSTNTKLKMKAIRPRD
jgi:hypothetical protein